MSRKNGPRVQDPSIKIQVEELLVLYGPMAIHEISVALDLGRSVVVLAMLKSKMVKRVGGLGSGTSPYTYGVVNHVKEVLDIK